MQALQEEHDWALPSRQAAPQRDVLTQAMTDGAEAAAMALALTDIANNPNQSTQSARFQHRGQEGPSGSTRLRPTSGMYEDEEEPSLLTASPLPSYKWTDLLRSAHRAAYLGQSRVSHAPPPQHSHEPEGQVWIRPLAALDFRAPVQRELVAYHRSQKGESTDQRVDQAIEDRYANRHMLLHETVAFIVRVASSPKQEQQSVGGKAPRFFDGPYLDACLSTSNLEDGFRVLTQEKSSLNAYEETSDVLRALYFRIAATTDCELYPESKFAWNKNPAQRRQGLAAWEESTERQGDQVLEERDQVLLSFWRKQCEAQLGLWLDQVALVLEVWI